MKPLIIVESPAKGRTISRFLKGNYDVRASFGHVRDLPKNKLGVDVEDNFEPTYTIPAKAKEHIKELKLLVSNADHIILATDEDREGEAIAWHLVKALDIEKHQKRHPTKVERIVFHEITQHAIENALKHPRDIDINLVDAQQTRRILDRLVGYGLSPFLWRKIRYGLSAGRVQSVALRLVVEREREITAFKAEEYWSIDALFSKIGDKKTFKSKLHALAGKPLDKFDIKDQKTAQEIFNKIEGSSFKVTDIQEKETKRNPSPPFTTSTLQQEASRKLGFSAKQTMAVAQSLYEGVHIGEKYGQVGLITYMRTDSFFLAESALKTAKTVIDHHFGKNYSLEQPRYYKSTSKGAQEAHEAIRPTHLDITPDDTKEYLDRNQQRLYALIWKRTIASQMQQAIMNNTSVLIDADKHAATFKSTGQTIIFDGFIKAYMEDTDDAEEGEDTLPKLEQGEKLDLKELKPSQHFTEPPPRYTDATLIKALESNGVGRPSTYAPTLSTIQERGYVEKIEKKYHPTEIGYLVTDLLVENFPEIVDIGFTAKIEDDFDNIAEGKQEWRTTLADFYSPFKKNLDEKEKSVEKKVEISTTPCPHCGQMMLIKFGRMGKFLACPEPGSKVTLPSPEEQAEINKLKEKTQGEKCPLCGKDMDIKRGRFGYFLGCIDYPNCKGIAKIVTRTGFKCPHCKIGDIIERKSRGRGKLFYGCSRYPECSFLMNVKPENETMLQQALIDWQEKSKVASPATRRGGGNLKKKTAKKNSKKTA